MEEVKICSKSELHRHHNLDAFSINASGVSNVNRSNRSNSGTSTASGSGRSMSILGGSAAGNNVNFGAAPYSSVAGDLLSTIAVAVTPITDKNEFNRQMDLTKVKEVSLN